MSPFDDWQWHFGQILAPLLLAIGIAAVVWDRRRHLLGGKTAPDGPEGEPYRVYSRQWDLELTAGEVPARLPDASPDLYHRHATGGGVQWRANRKRVAEWRERQPDREALAAPVSAALAAADMDAAEVSVTLLADQSGSMKGAPMQAAVAALSTLSAALTELGVAHEILGHSTAGWRGGYAYQHWQSHGRPRRPGRLCALLHIVYKSMGDTEWNEPSQHVFVHPDLARENVDGEAIEWAVARAARSHAPHRVLIHLSDGAPVDDATLRHNGKSILERHLLRVLATVGEDGAVTIGAVGIGHDVSRYYPRSRQAELETIAAETAALLADLIAGS